MKYLIFLCLTLSLNAAEFKIQNVNPSYSGCGLQCELTVTTSGSLAAVGAVTPEQILRDPANWTVRVFEKQGTQFIQVPFAILKIEVNNSPIPGEVTVSMRFSESELGGKDPQALKWNLAFWGAGELQSASYYNPGGVSSAPSGAKALADVFSPAPDMTKADLYISGSILAGQGTKPIYMIDAKINVAPPISHKDVRAGVYAEIQSNADAEPPNDKSEADPDSIRAFATVNGLWKSLYWDLRPAGGEFSRKYPASSFVASGTVAWWPDTYGAPGRWFVFYPSLGVEVGTNLNKPAMLFEQPADLSRYNTIARIVPSVNTSYFLWGSEDNPKVTVNAGYQVRLLLADEPFTTLEYYTKADGTQDRAKFVHMRDNARHWVTGGVTWNVGDYVGITAQYKYGSQPPLFELVQHQVTLGVVFQSRLWGRK